MKNKALTYVLLVVVAAIWYQVFFRVKGSLVGTDEAITPLTDQAHMQMPVFSRDTFELLANYRDPFGETKINAPTVDVPVTEVIGVPKPPKPVFTWPSIHYLGQVKKTSSKNPLAIVNIDGLQLMVRTGDELFNDIKVKRIGRDSIVVVYKRKTKVVRRAD